MISSIISRLVILLFGNLYPAYASYKAVRTKNVKEYVKWMMYWIVFALFTCCETFTDVFLGFWFPFYYEIKIILVIWLLSPATKGSSFLYRKFVHPMLTRREPEIDEYLSRAKEQSYHTMLHLGSRGMTYATNVIMQTAIKGGGGIVNHLRRSYSLCDLSSNSDIMSDVNLNNKNASHQNDSATDGSATSSFQRDQRTTRSMRKAAAGNNHVDMYFPEVDVNIRSHASRESSVPLGQIRSTDDISSGYSSADPVYAGEMAAEGLMRTSSVGGARARTTRGGSTRTASKRGLTTEDSDHLEVFDERSPPSSWIPTKPTIPFYPSPFYPVCISAGSDKRILFSPNIDVIKNQLALLKSFQDLETENNLTVNLKNRPLNNSSNFLLPNDCNFSVCEVGIFSDSNTVDNNEESFCKTMILAGKSGEKVLDKEVEKSSENNDVNSVLSQEEDKSVYEPPKLFEDSDFSRKESNCDRIESPEESFKLKCNDSLEENLNLMLPEKFHDSLMDLSLVDNYTGKHLSVISTEFQQSDLIVNKTNSSINDEDGMLCENEANNSSSNYYVAESSKISPVSPDIELKPETPPRKGRYNKKKRAPLPPNVKKIDSRELENDEDYFQDAESNVISISREVEDSKINQQNSLSDGPDLVSEINVLDVKINEFDDVKDYRVTKDVIEDKLENNNSNFNNKFSNSGNYATEIPRKSDTPSLIVDGKSKSKNPSKLSKFLPKSSNVPSLFGFLHGKDIHPQSEEAIVDSVMPSGFIASVDDYHKDGKIDSVKACSDESERIFIPLTEDGHGCHKEGYVQIREMSHSPTARRRKPNDL